MSKENQFAEILKDGKVDEQETAMLRHAFFEDGVIDKEEADAMFELNDATTGNENAPEFNELFIEVISSYVLEDDETPDVISKEEGDYLVEKIGADGQCDALEQELLISLDNNAVEILSENLLGLIAKVKA